jgi:hypothetical protein
VILLFEHVDLGIGLNFKLSSRDDFFL